MLATVSTSGATIAGAAGAAAGEAAGAAAGEAAGDAAGDAAGSAAAAAGEAAGAAAGANHGFTVPLATHFNSATVPRPSSTETLSIHAKDVGVAQAGHGPLGKGSLAAFAVVAAVSNPPTSEMLPSATRILFFTFPPSVKARAGGPDIKSLLSGVINRECR